MIMLLRNAKSEALVSFALAFFVVAKVVLLFKYHLVIWDEAVYLGMGKYIYSLGSSGLWEVIRPPGLPLALGWIWKLGLPYVLFSEAIAVLFGIGNIFLAYIIAKRLFNKKIAVLTAALLASSPVFFLYSSQIFTEIPSTLFALAAIYFFLNKRCFLCGACSALAMLFKFPHGFLLPVGFGVAVYVSHLIKNLPLIRAGNFAPFIKGLLHRAQILPLAKVAVFFAATALPFLVVNYALYRPFTGNSFDAIFRPFILGSWHQLNPAKAVPGVLYNYIFYAAQSFMQHFMLIFALVAVFIFWKRKWFADSGKLLLAAMLAIYFAYFSYIPNKDERFLLTFLPMICIFAAAAFFETVDYFILAVTAANIHRSIQRSYLKLLNWLILAAAVSLLVISFAVALYRDYNSFSTRQGSEPQIVSELYHSPSRLGISGTIITSEPVFAVYNDNLFLPYYDSSRGIPKELKPSWREQPGPGRPFEAIIFSPQTLYCPESDYGCLSDKERLFDLIKSNYKQVFNATYYNGWINYFIFVNESINGNR